MNAENANGRAVKTDETLLAILTALNERSGAGVTELADHLGLAKSTVHGHLKTLHDQEFVVKEDGSYHLGLRFLDLGETARLRSVKYEMIKEKTEEIADRTDERTQFIVEEHGWGVYLYKAIGSNAVRTHSTIGARLPLYASAAGKAILAGLPEARAREIVGRNDLERMTENTITDPGRLFEDIERTRERGYAINEEESTPGLHAVGVSVTDSDGEVIGAFSVSGPTHRMKEELFETEVPRLMREVANEIELNITFS